MTKGGFKTTDVKGFVPKGKFVKNEEEFGGLDELEDEAPKKKNNKKGKGKGPQKVKVEQKEEEEEVDNSTPWKGKPSSFFVM